MGSSGGNRGPSSYFNKNSGSGNFFEVYFGDKNIGVFQTTYVMFICLKVSKVFN